MSILLNHIWYLSSSESYENLSSVNWWLFKQMNYLLRMKRAKFCIRVQVIRPSADSFLTNFLFFKFINEKKTLKKTTLYETVRLNMFPHVVIYSRPGIWGTYYIKELNIMFYEKKTTEYGQLDLYGDL